MIGSARAHWLDEADSSRSFTSPDLLGASNRTRSLRNVNAPLLSTRVRKRRYATSLRAGHLVVSMRRYV